MASMHTDFDKFKKNSLHAVQVLNINSDSDDNVLPPPPFFFKPIFLRCGLKQTSTLAKRSTTKPTVTFSVSTIIRPTPPCLWMK